ncbi:MAG: DUF1512 family protein [Candidatus Aenigmarchaeota archaeon]|nr:DUF1512 family protein [Candidatus Aenigmarchaeota archaeon]
MAIIPGTESTDMFGQIVSVVWLGLFVVMFFFSQRIMIMQILVKSEAFAQQLENMTEKGKKHVLKKLSKNPDRKLKDSVNNFLEFFMIEPVSLDPYGIMKKIEHLVDLQEKRFKYYVDRTAPQLNSEEKANAVMGLSGAVSLNQIAKIVRHFVELIKKTKSLQYAIILQMQLPLIERIAKALLDGTEALSNGWPIGDAAGSMAVANMIGTSPVRKFDDETLVCTKKIKGRTVFIVKARGPGGRLGKLGKTVEQLVMKNKVAKIITVDAAAKLEGEKTGSLAEGVGVAIGGPGVDRSYIEKIAVDRNLPLDGIIIKMSQEEAIQPIKREVLSAIPKAVQLVEANIGETTEKGAIIVVGVGNTGGVGNNKKAADDSEQLAKKVLQIVSSRKKDEKKSFLSRIGF